MMAGEANRPVIWLPGRTSYRSELSWRPTLAGRKGAYHFRLKAEATRTEANRGTARNYYPSITV
jgi:hypothetical protein